MGTNIRLRILLVIIVLISSAISVRVFFLSFQKPEDYTILNVNDYNVKRGDIFDRNGMLLAVSDELQSVYANPKNIKTIDKTANELSMILNMSRADILNKLKDNKNFVWIKRKISPAEAKLIARLNLQGIGLKMEYKRFYPNKILASHILGFCNIDSHGMEGIEKSMDKYLYPDVSGLSSNSFGKKNINGSNIILTIDANIQAAAEKALKEALINENADYVSMILLDGKTGEVLSMANAPDFDPNNYEEFNQIIFRNSSIFDQFEPGSIMKVFTIASLLDLKRLDKSDHFFCPGYYTKDGITVEDTGKHGMVNYYSIIKYSCNTGMLKAAERIRPYEFFNYLKAFGFSTRTNVELPGEQPGMLRDLKDWTERSMMALPIGQEISVNALQVARAASVFINDGVMVDPFIVKKIFNDDNKLIYSGKRREVRRVIAPGVSQKIIDAMKTSTEPGGTNSRLNVEGLSFAAKSGTGQIYDYEAGRYSSSEFTSSLLVIFPADKPRYILYTVFQKPRGRIYWGGVIGSRLVNEFLGMLTGYFDMGRKDDIYFNGNDIKINDRYKQFDKIPQYMPDLTGLDAGEIIRIFKKTGIKINVYGSGTVSTQSPVPGEALDKSSIIKLYLK